MNFNRLKNIKPWLPAVLAVLLVVVEWTMFRLSIFDDSPSLIATVLKGLPDAALVILPYWFVPRRWRGPALIVPLWLLSAFFVVNLVYERFFETLLPLSSLFFFDNFNSLVFEGAMVNVTWSDWLYIILPAAYTIGYFTLLRRLEPPTLSRRLKLAATGVTLLMYAGCQLLYIKGVDDRWKSEGFERSMPDLLRYKYLESADSFVDLSYNGVPTYLAKLIYQELAVSRKVIALDEQQQKRVDDFLAEHSRICAPTDTLFKGLGRRNLVFIIVESLNADAVGKKIGGESVTPTLDALLAQPGTLSNLHVMTQVGDGGSSDGQMIYNTGLLPIDRGAAIILYDSNVYPSLAKSLPGYHAVEVIGEKPHYWNHDKSTLLYGFDRLYSVDSVAAAGIDAASLGADRSLFLFAEKLLPQLPRPFYLEITTLSMHVPFNEPAAVMPTAFRDADISDVERNYYTVTRYFDESLGAFIEALKRAGVYDETLVVIASDHNCALRADDYDNGTDARPGEIVFIALNSGRDTELPQKPVGQVDVFPTILDLMGDAVVAEGGWRGLGVSMLSPQSGGAIDRKGAVAGCDDEGRRRHLIEAPAVSNLLIRSNHFAPR